MALSRRLRNSQHSFKQALREDRLGQSSGISVLSEVDFLSAQDRRKGVSMARVQPLHSIKQTVRRDNIICNTGDNIERENVRSGTGGKPLCSECVQSARGR